MMTSHTLPSRAKHSKRKLRVVSSRKTQGVPLPSARDRKLSRTEKKSRLSTEELLSFETEVFRRTCEDIDTPRSLCCWLLVSTGEWQQYLGLTFPDPLSDRFPDDYLVTEMFSKHPGLPIPIDKEAVALTAFRQSESLCRETNQRFQTYYETPSESYKELHTIFGVQQILNTALGPLSKNRLASLDQNFRFGPGSTSTVSGSDVLLSRKYVSQWETSPRLRPYAASITGAAYKEPVVIRGSRVITVPKNAKTDRTICIEPHLNIFYQLGVGALLRSTLTRLGLQPNDQSRNRLMCREAVRRGYATIDLSAASDTISYEVVKRLLPPDWFDLLYLGRSDQVLLEGEWLSLEKFSSMGNGFTWELESLIFYAIARSLTNEEIGVFGDDLVVPEDIVPSLKEVLEFFGFKMNIRKSFWQGDFRESCGEDWWRDVNIRPFYFRKDVKHAFSVQHYSIQIANAIRLYSHRRGSNCYCDRIMLRSWLYAKRRCGLYSTTCTSLGYGDDGLIKNFDESSPSISKSLKRQGHQGYRAIVAKRRSIISKCTSEVGAYLAALHRGTPDGSSRNVEYVRGRLHRPRTEIVLVFDWYNLGPWL